MDPTACLRRIEHADTKREERDACEDLQNWLLSGGFQPQWSQYQGGSVAFVRWRKRNNITAPAISTT